MKVYYFIGSQAVVDGVLSLLPFLPAIGGLHIMNFKELVDAVSAETSLPAAEVRKVSTALLSKFAGLIESQTNFTSPQLALTAVTIPARPAAEGKPARAERKIGRLTIRIKKPAA